MVYKLKVDEKGGMRFEARIWPHGNRDDMKDDFRIDLSTAQFNVIRLALPEARGMDAELGHVDIQGDYLKSGPIRQTIYVRPLCELGAQLGTIWKLT